MMKQVAWTERTFSFEFPVGLFPVIVSRLEGSIFRLQAILNNADDERCSYALTGWPVKTHLGHLYDLEELWWNRLQDSKLQKPVLTAADIANRKTTDADSPKNKLEHLLQLFILERQKMLELVYTFTDDELLITSLHPRLQQPMRLIDSLYFVAEHDDHHIAHISNLLK